jgi:hypothetical protein
MTFRLSGLARQQRLTGKFYLTTQGKAAAFNGELAKTKTGFANPIL